jgi:hypothetical protein
MNKYDFNPERCKLALTKLNDYLSGEPATLQEARDALDAVFLDVEALHRKAQECDDIRASIASLPYREETDEILSCYDSDETPDMNL